MEPLLSLSSTCEEFADAAAVEETAGVLETGGKNMGEVVSAVFVSVEEV